MNVGGMNKNENDKERYEHGKNTTKKNKTKKLEKRDEER